MKFSTITAALALTCASTVASAATVTVSSFSAGAYNAAVGAAGTVITEDFESFSENMTGANFGTSVGTFNTIGGVGTGGTVTQSGFVNSGDQLAIRDGNVFGRTSTTAILEADKSKDKFLDSNDTFGIDWLASLGGGAFNQIILTLSDAADTGARMQISANGATSEFSSAGNGNKQLVVIKFDTAVTSASILFENLSNSGNLTNDGFSIDDIALSAVPLPGTAALLLAGLGGLGALKRRRKTV